MPGARFPGTVCRARNALSRRRAGDAHCYRFAGSACWVRLTGEAYWNRGQRRTHQLAKNASRNSSSRNARCNRLAGDDDWYRLARRTRKARRYPCKAAGYKLDRKRNNVAGGL